MYCSTHTHTRFDSIENGDLQDSVIAAQMLYIRGIVNVATACRNRQEMSRLEGELESLRDRYSSTSEALASTNEDRVRLTEQVDDVKQQLHRMGDAKNAAQRAAMKQVRFSFINVILQSLTRS